MPYPYPSFSIYIIVFELKIDNIVFWKKKNRGNNDLIYYLGPTHFNLSPQYIYNSVR